MLIGTGRETADDEGGRPAESLYVLGHARTGTTVWGRYLNSSPNVFLLYEANTDTESRFKYWRQRYNHMHHVNGQPPTKGYYLPEVWGESFDDVEQHLKAAFAYVGDKIALRTTSDASYPALAFSLRQKWFERDAPRRVLLTLRNPDAAVSSCVDMFGDRLETDIRGKFAVYYESFAQVLWLQLCIFFGIGTSAFAVLELAHASRPADTADALGMRRFEPSLPSTVFRATAGLPSSGGRRGKGYVPSSVLRDSETRDLRDACLAAYAAILAAAEYSPNGDRNLVSQVFCTQRAGAVFGVFGQLHSILFQRGLLYSAQLVDPALGKWGAWLNDTLPQGIPPDIATAKPAKKPAPRKKSPRRLDSSSGTPGKRA